MVLRNFKRYKLNESSDESTNDSLVYSESSDEENHINNLKTPNYSILNKKCKLLKIRQNPDYSSRKQCHIIFSYPNFDTKLNDTTNRIEPSIIDNVRKNFKNVMNDIQKGELNITTNINELNNFEYREQTFSLDVNCIDYIHLNKNEQENEQENNSRKRAYSLDIQYVEECIQNGTI